MIANLIGIALVCLCVMAIAVCVVIIATLIRSSRKADRVVAAEKLAREPTQFQRETFASLCSALTEAACFASTEQQRLRLIVLATARIADALENHANYALDIGTSNEWDSSEYRRLVSRARGLADVLSYSVRWPARTTDADVANALADASVAPANK